MIFKCNFFGWERTDIYALQEIFGRTKINEIQLYSFLKVKKILLQQEKSKQLFLGCPAACDGLVLTRFDAANM
jgi:hypothetical protein